MTGNYRTEGERFGPVMLASNIVFFNRHCAVPFASASCIEFRAAYPALLLPRVRTSVNSARNPTVRCRVPIAPSIGPTASIASAPNLGEGLPHLADACRPRPDRRAGPDSDQLKLKTSIAYSLDREIVGVEARKF
jgi:hypothetical protein